MIIGNGLLGSAFIEFDLPEVVFFASGVSNSSEISEKEFNREENLIHKILEIIPKNNLSILVHVASMILLRMAVLMSYTN